MKDSIKGNITIITLVATLVLLLVFLSLFDLCRVFIAREKTKNAADAAALAVSQNLIFFEKEDIESIALKVLSQYNCQLVSYRVSYDEVIIVAGKKLDFLIIDKFIHKYDVIKSISKAKVIYPWDKKLNYCEYYQFKY
ncbi:MAG: pilus assembly protein TadG-related protein [Candidatus Humimicrobiaceae bacterium]